MRKHQQIGLKQNSSIVDRVGRVLGHERKSTLELPEPREDVVHFNYILVSLNVFTHFSTNKSRGVVFHFLVCLFVCLLTQAHSISS